MAIGTTENEAPPPRREVLLAQIQFLSDHSERVLITDHANERMDERDISASMMFRVLKTGRISGEIRRGKTNGEWVVKIAGNIKGNRDVGVVTAVFAREKLIVITVEWEDLK